MVKPPPTHHQKDAAWQSHEIQLAVAPAVLLMPIYAALNIRIIPVKPSPIETWDWDLIQDPGSYPMGIGYPSSLWTPTHKWLVALCALVIRWWKFTKVDKVPTLSHRLDAVGPKTSPLTQCVKGPSANTTQL